MTIVWKQPAVPQHVIQMIVYCETTGKILLIHRSPEVRSASNVWSTPSGMHDIGDSIKETIVKELNEEFNLGGSVIGDPQVVFQYENIAGDDPSKEQYHWVISVYFVEVSSFVHFKNMEPLKHDKWEFVDFEDLQDDEFYKKYNFHPSYEKALRTNFVLGEDSIDSQAC